ncbi:MAG: PEP-CTERM sorting domain-containing protein [Thermoguttaceae bacterium]|nr:PEP-CTERM sorting domain-containing protein [Thermoguttaceae bacterium]
MKKSHITQIVFLFMALAAVTAQLRADYTWTRAVDELNTDYTNTTYWSGTNGQVYVSGPTVNVSKGHTVTIDKTFNLGAANTTTNLNINGVLNLTGGRPVAGYGDNCVNVITVNGTLTQTAVNFCFGENYKTDTTMTINPGAVVTMSGLIGSRGTATINIGNNALLHFDKNVTFGWNGGNTDTSYMGVIKQTGGLVNAMTTNRQWTSISGISWSSAARGNDVLPDGQYFLSGGIMNTLRMSPNSNYDEQNYNPSTTSNYSNVNAVKNGKCFIMSGGQANIVSVSNITANDSAQFGTLSVATQFTGGTLNVLKIDASRMKNDTFVQDGGLLSPSGGTWANNRLTVAPNGISSTTVTGSYTQNAGAIRLDVASASSYDTMTVSGTANLNGVLNIIDQNGATEGSQTYTLLTAGTLTRGADYALNVGGKNVSSYTADYSDNKVTLTVNYGATQTYTWTGGAAETNEFLTAGNWNPSTGTVNFQNHIFGDATNGNAYAKVPANNLIAGSNDLTMASGSTTATLDVEGSMTIGKFQNGGGTANINVSGNGTLDFTGQTVFTGGSMTLSGNSKTTLSYTTSSNVRSYIGQGDSTTNFTMKDNASFQVNIGNNDGNRYFIIGGDAGAGTTTFNMQDNSVMLVEANPSRDAGTAMHWGGKGTVTSTLSGNATFLAEIRLFFGEDDNGNRLSTLNLTENSRMFTGLFLNGGAGNTQINIQGNAYLNIDGECCIGYGTRVTNNTFTQTGGLAEIWGDGRRRWTDRRAGITFGGNGGAQSNGTYQLQGGTLNTYGITYRSANTQTVTAPLLEMSGGEMNVIPFTDGTLGSIEVPFNFTGGTLNVAKVVGFGKTRSKTWFKDHNDGKNDNNTFFQSGGVLSPDGGSVMTQETGIGDFGKATYKTFVPSATGISRTEIVGHYTLSGTGAVKLDINEWATEASENNDLVTVTGNANISGSGGIKVNLSDALAAAVLDGSYTGDGKLLLMTANTYSNAGSIPISSWENQLPSADYKWYPTVEGKNLYGNLRALNQLTYWTTGNDWSENVNIANTFYVGSTAHGGNANAQNAVLNQSNAALGAMNIGEGSGDQGKLTITGSPVIASTQNQNIGLSGTGELVIEQNANVSFNSTVSAGLNEGGKGTLTIGTQGSETGPTVFMKTTRIAGESNKGVGVMNMHSGNFTTNTLDFAHTTATNNLMTMTGGTINVNGMMRFTEMNTSKGTFNMTGGTLNLNQNTTWGSHGETTVTISGGTINSTGQFVLNFYEKSDFVTQTGGTVNLWSNSNVGWGVRTNPGFILNYSSKGQNDWQAGLQFGNTGGADSLRGKNGEQIWDISGGSLNTYRIFTLINTTDTMLKISGDAVVNVISGGSVNDGKYYGILAAPTEMTGGTLNAETIIAVGDYHNKAGDVTQTNHNYMKNGQFLQQGGTLSPDGGTVENNAYVPGTTGATTDIYGNYVVDLSGQSDKSTPAICLDIYSDSDYDQVNVFGNLTIDPEASLKIRYGGESLSELMNISDIFTVEGTEDQNTYLFKQINVEDMAGNLLASYGGDVLTATVLGDGLQIGFGGMAGNVPEPSTWLLLIFGLAGLGISRKNFKRVSR